MVTVMLLVLVLAYLFIASFFTRAPMGELRPLPRGRRAALWESFYRPYASLAPRRRGRRAPSSSSPPRTPPLN